MELVTNDATSSAKSEMSHGGDTPEKKKSRGRPPKKDTSQNPAEIIFMKRCLSMGGGKSPEIDPFSMDDKLARSPATKKAATTRVANKESSPQPVGSGGTDGQQDESLPNNNEGPSERDVRWRSAVHFFAAVNVYRHALD